MEKNIFVIFTTFLAVVALLFTIATLQSENDKLRNVLRLFKLVRWTDITTTS